MKQYDHKKVEKKWRDAWSKERLYETHDDDSRERFYHLVMLPYPSGNLHMGHWWQYAPTDVLARYRRMKRFNVLNPIGFDAFGLPAENAAIKRKLHPKDWTYDNIAHMRKQLASMGPSFDWSREIITSDPEYYKWTQWMFLQLFKKGLAYRAEVPANWCPSCKTVLANEQVVSGTCERCGSEVTHRNVEQWMFKITAYADELLKSLDDIDWPERTKTMQRNWIGRSEGAEIEFSIKYLVSGITGEPKSQIQNTKYKIQVFTTRPDTVFGATYLVLAPEHELLKNLESRIQNLEEVRQYTTQAAKKTEIERTSTEREKTGVELKGISAINPATKEEIPIWISDYVLSHYGTGAIMAVPAHDERDYEFAKKFNLPIRWVVKGVDPSLGERGLEAWQILVGDHAYTGHGWMADSGKFTGMESEAALPKMVSWMEKEGWEKRAVTYRLHDWIVSRQRYWGAPIPIVYCKSCEIVPVPEEELPVLLPEIKDYTPPGDGKSPLARSEKFVHTKCPQCGGKAERETDTMDTFVDSSWYFLRYVDPHNNKEFASPTKIKKWLPVDLYLGGSEHAVMHLLYARFFTKALADMGHLAFREPFLALRHQGIILGEDNEKMSKSRGNVVDPDELVATFGADTVRMYLCFMGDYGEGGPWNPGGINGAYRFLNRVRRFYQLSFPRRRESRILDPRVKPEDDKNHSELQKLLHKTVKKVGEDIERLKFNTAVSALMVLFREMESSGTTNTECAEMFLGLLAPFAPFMTEELWRETLKKPKSIHVALWPRFDEKLSHEETFTLVVQINGKVRGTLALPMHASEKDALSAAQSDSGLKKHLEGKTPSKVIFVKNRLINILLDM